MSPLDELFGRVSEITARTGRAVLVTATHAILTRDGRTPDFAVARTGDLNQDLDRLAVGWAQCVRLANLAREADASPCS